MRQKRLGHHEAKHPVAQEFQPLIVVAIGRGHRGMGQRPDQQRGVGKFMPEPRLKLRHVA